jgi:hypothetical protein
MTPTHTTGTSPPPLPERPKSTSRPGVYATASVRRGSDRACRFGRSAGVRIAHLAESVAAECGVLEPDFRNRYEEKSTYSSV